MAKKLILKNCFIEIDGVDLSEYVNQVEISTQKAEVDTTNFGGQGKERQAGLSDDSFGLTIQQSFAAASVDATLWPLFQDEEEFVVKVRPTSAAISATNPEYSGTCILLKYTPLTGKPGDLSETKLELPVQREGIQRAVA